LPQALVSPWHPALRAYRGAPPQAPRVWQRLSRGPVVAGASRGRPLVGSGPV